MRAQTFKRHPLDRHVLLSENIVDIQRVTGTHFKAGFISQAADQQLTTELLSVSPSAKYHRRSFPAFYHFDTAPDFLREDFSPRSIARLAEINRHFQAAAGGRPIDFVICRNLGEFAKASGLMHFEGMLPNGPNEHRAFRGNLSVGKKNQSQMRWLPTNHLTYADIDLVMSYNRSHPAQPLDQAMPDIKIESAASGDFAALHGLDYAYFDKKKDGLLHSGPESHDRASYLLNARHPA